MNPSKSFPNTAETLLEILARDFDVEPNTVKDESFFLLDLALDSLDMVELSMAVELEFGIDIDEDQWREAKTFGQAINLIDRLRFPDKN